LVVLPGSLSLEAGAAPAYLEATVLGSEAPVRWRLEGAGSLSTLQGKTTRYTPPATLSAPASAQIVASLENSTLEQTVPVQLKVATAMLALVLPEGMGERVSAGSGPYRFRAQRSPDSAGEVVWSLEGPGQLSSAQGLSSDYTPPATLLAPVNVLVRAKLGTLERSYSFQVTPKPSLSVTPAQSTLTASGAPQAFTAQLLYSDARVNWVQNPPFVGSLSDPFSTTTVYTPPVDVEEVQTVTLTAYAAGLTRTATLTIYPRPRIIFDLPGDTLSVAQGAFTFRAFIKNTTQPITWSLEPSVGRLEQGQNSQITYIPPPDLAQTTRVTVRARSSELDQSVTLKLIPIAAVRFIFEGQDLIYPEGKMGLSFFAYSPDGKNPSQVSAMINDPIDGSKFTYLMFYGIELRPLVLGTYLNVQEAGFGNLLYGGLNFRTQDYTCRGIGGQFTIKRLESDVEKGYRLSHFLATFTQTCAGGEKTVSGTMVYGPLAEVKAFQP